MASGDLPEFLEFGEVLLYLSVVVTMSDSIIRQLSFRFQLTKLFAVFDGSDQNASGLELGLIPWPYCGTGRYILNCERYPAKLCNRLTGPFRFLQLRGKSGYRPDFSAELDVPGQAFDSTLFHNQP
jgi:hypothetical protein